MFEGFGAQTIMSSCLVDRDLTNDVSNLLRFISGMTKLVVGQSLDEVNFFSCESSRTESLEWSSSPSCSRILVKNSFNSLATDDSSYTVPFSVSNSTILAVRFPEPLRAFQIPLGFPLFSSICSQKKDRKWRNDRRSERNLCNCVKKPEKNSGLQLGLNPRPCDYRCDALPTELWSHWC